MKYLEFAENVRALGEYKVDFGKDKVTVSKEVEVGVVSTGELKAGKVNKVNKVKKMEIPKKKATKIAEVSMKDQYKYSCDAGKYPEVHELCYKLAITDILKRGFVSVAE